MLTKKKKWSHWTRNIHATRMWRLARFPSVAVTNRIEICDQRSGSVRLIKFAIALANISLIKVSIDLIPTLLFIRLVVLSTVAVATLGQNPANYI